MLAMAREKEEIKGFQGRTEGLESLISGYLVSGDVIDFVEWGQVDYPAVLLSTLHRYEDAVKLVEKGYRLLHEECLAEDFLKLLSLLYGDQTGDSFVKMPSKAQLLLREYLISEVDELSEGETLSGEVFDELAEEIGKKVNCFPAQYVKWLVPISKDFPDLFDQLLEAVDLENFPALVTQLCSDVALMEEGLQTGNGSELSRGAAEWKSARDKLMPEDEAEWNEFLEELEKKDGKFFSEETEEEWEKRISEDEDDWGSIFPEEDDDWENHLSEAADILNKYFPEDDDIWRN